MTRRCDNCGGPPGPGSLCDTCNRVAYSHAPGPTTVSGPPSRPSITVTIGSVTPARHRRRGLVLGIAAAVALPLLLCASAIAFIVVFRDAQEHQAREAVENGFRAWSEAEAGDRSACATAAEYIVVDGKNVEEECLGEVGSFPGMEVTRLEVTDVELGITSGVATVTWTTLSEDGPKKGEASWDLRRVDGDWKLDWSP